MLYHQALIDALLASIKPKTPTTLPQTHGLLFDFSQSPGGFGRDAIVSNLTLVSAKVIPLRMLARVLSSCTSNIDQLQGADWVWLGVFAKIGEGALKARKICGIHFNVYAEDIMAQIRRSPSGDWERKLKWDLQGFQNLYREVSCNPVYQGIS